ncbi:class II 3-deoxy-7-phosphoheptulonate synthase [Sedimenticola selenatireducens]|uniref:Phospho-2-dehydro-3-deoxyheptonate aldolase n=1 Tax=Sedimenticola selenatireducens TaxID=191960 RepID=A0A2N6CZC0_9GAMM|nr:3-deoxy-7-phosphoheptulonate synthase class II [Sedimenticola selenatireducens]PLX62726.1 MAG: 3-deoxy-7-phosphoheptulonate synthase class II [Sedimenticola selenatireducens]
MNHWHPKSWQEKPAKQQANYPSADALDATLEQLSLLPPLVTSWEVEALKSQLAAAARGEAFLLQGGDCAENFSDCNAQIVTNKLKILLQMSLLLIHGLNKPVIRVGRIAGQFAKPRSADTETIDGITLPSYRGDLINGPEFTPEARIPDPVRLLRGYGRAAMTLNFIRALSDCGFADLHHPENWDLDFMSHSPLAEEYHQVVAELSHSLKFMETLGGARNSELNRVQFFTSHEGLHLHYEQSLTRQVPNRSGYYNLTTHLPWIGFRTAATTDAHIEYFSGIQNPVGVKVGPGMSAQWIEELVERLNPENQEGKLLFIHRFGVDKIADGLPQLIQAVKRTGRHVLWVSDPMHGNTESTQSGYKTRRFDNIIGELEQAIAIHQSEGSILGGVHFELTGDDVTECIGGARGLDEAGLKRAYKTQVDPRLNYEQALEMALAITRKLGRT